MYTLKSFIYNNILYYSKYMYVRRTTRRNCSSRVDQTSVGIIRIFCTRQCIVHYYYYYTQIGIGMSSSQRLLSNKNTKKMQCLPSLFAFFPRLYIIMWEQFTCIIICDDNIPTLKHERTRTYDLVENSRLSKFSFTINTAATTQLPDGISAVFFFFI